ncbi:4f2ac1b8-49e8-4c0a-8603-3dff6ab190fb [Sclerotinia trifoliorum]|uniref:4f2ac1b8-49e8-4c0a-8603-3dff6ab190fb n=1 Tax=Sclerotinia trifoliorum TaxID=28548 RepID=A0A8H2VVK2_9HELO|nr:4f2ac1b8-49e8-4c0a-8603-3dff6ab190fb [Sclerotinia trifoliorum]
MSSIDMTLTKPVPILSPVELQNFSENEIIAAAGRSENEKFVEQSLEIPIGDSNPDIVLVDYEENDPENSLNWSPTQKWLIVFGVSWMGFVSVFSTMSIMPTAPQILHEFHSRSTLDQTLLVTIWELGEGIGPFFIAPLSERFGRLLVFHIANFLALCCLIACALSVNIPILIAFRSLAGCFCRFLPLGSPSSGFVPNRTYQLEHGIRHRNSDDSRFYLTYCRSVYCSGFGLAMVDLAGGHRTRILQLVLTGRAPRDIRGRHSKAEGGAIIKGKRE